jgi:hypothetical protein
VSVTLVDCASGWGNSCGEIKFIDETGDGCTFPVHWHSREDAAERLWLPADPPLEDGQLVYEVDFGCFECNDEWLSGTVLYVRLTPDGALELTPEWTDVWPRFVLAPSSPRDPEPPYSLRVEPTTLHRGDKVSIAVTGAESAFVSLAGHEVNYKDIGEIPVDSHGAGTLVTTMPAWAPTGTAEFAVDGRFLNSYCGIEDYMAITVVEIDATLPPTDSGVSPGNPTRAPFAGGLLLVIGLLAVAVAGLLSVHTSKRD